MTLLNEQPAVFHSETCTFYVEDYSGEKVPCIGVLRMMSEVSAIDHIGAEDTAEMIIDTQPRKVWLSDQELTVSQVLIRGRFPRLIIQRGFDDLFPLCVAGQKKAAAEQRRADLEAAELGGASAAEFFGYDRQLTLGECGVFM